MRSIRLRGSAISPKDLSLLENTGQFNIIPYSATVRKVSALESLAKYEAAIVPKEAGYVQAFELHTTMDQETQEAFEDIIVIRPSTTSIESLVGLITQHHVLASHAGYTSPSILYDSSDLGDSPSEKTASLMVGALNTMGMKVYFGVTDLITR